MKHLLASVSVAVLMAGANPVTAQTPADQLIVAFNMNNVLTMDPAAITGGDAVQILNNIYDSLVSLDPETRVVIPRLAERWEVAEDNRSVTFHLNPDAVFASGNPVTAEDVRFSLTRVLEMNQAQSSGLRSRGFTAEEAENLFVAEDTHTFVLNLPQDDDPRLILMYLTQAGVGSILDSQLVQENLGADYGQSWLTNNSAGSSAFTLTQWRANEFVILNRNPNYWADAPEMARVLMRHLPESQSQRLGLERGDIDVGFSLAATDLRALAAVDGVTVTTEPSSNFYYLAASMEDERFANPKVREALRYLIDYDGINAAIMPYFGVKRQIPVNSTAFAALPDPGYTLDVERARELLAEAGYPDGFSTTLRVISTQEFLDSATAIQGTLAQAGIRAEIITGDGGQIYGAMRDRRFELLVGRGGGGQQPHPDSNLRALVYNPDNSQEAQLDNYQGWRTSFFDEELNAMIEAALIERDEDTQFRMYEEIQQMTQDKVIPILPFSERVVTAAYQVGIEGIIIDPWVSRFEYVTKGN
ncbi:ABC transporter substrate-binding protein [Roseinatronobacter alkalisoli]|uniref:ABC transporter substrate-binding protein n=1 Tax=Roseinatronobacter alkalisoli TaxID=3028235 RepID=A0ABT5T799_9RHOB|nr:ABC transporter substrate-binding protein [Roseinatronobacter sp. HJB301]MDD7970987.1 ABC transporter substrate-binding protein [Roseinatronobacter sp. HJB301]